MITYEVETLIYSDVLDTHYAVGKTKDKKYVYVWTKFNPENLTQEMVENPECDHGAMIGTLDEIVDEIEECVGSFRYHGDEAQQEASWEVVEELLSAFGLESRYKREEMK